MEKNLQSYNEEIKKYFIQVKSTILPDVEPLTIKNRYDHLIDNDISNEDKKIINNFIKIKSAIKVNENLGDDVTHFKNVSNYLNHRIKGFRLPESYNFVAWLIGFRPRPFTNYLKNKDFETKVQLNPQDIPDSSKTKNTINISDIESGKNTNFSLNKTESTITIKNIKSGKNTKFDI